MPTLAATTRRWEAAANRLRAKLSRTFGLPPPRRIILAPGVLVALHILFRYRRTERILMADDEYYDASHFPGCVVQSVPFDSLARCADRVRPDVIIVSLVTWRGRLNPVKDMFRQVRSRVSTALLVADCTHALAVQRERLDGLGADLVLGDASKWLIEQDDQSTVGFLWCGSETVNRACAPAFYPFFLATSRRQSRRMSRFVVPGEVDRLERTLARLDLSKAALTNRYRENHRIAAALRASLGQQPAESNIVWVPGSLSKVRLGDREHLNLWRIPHAGTRILCRSKLQSFRG